jgi:hypothetical protein
LRHCCALSLSLFTRLADSVLSLGAASIRAASTEQPLLSNEISFITAVNHAVNFQGGHSFVVVVVIIIIIIIIIVTNNLQQNIASLRCFFLLYRSPRTVMIVEIN